MEHLNPPSSRVWNCRIGDGGPIPAELTVLTWTWYLVKGWRFWSRTRFLPASADWLKLELELIRFSWIQYSKSGSVFSSCHWSSAVRLCMLVIFNWFGALGNSDKQTIQPDVRWEWLNQNNREGNKRKSGKLSEKSIPLYQGFLQILGKNSKFILFFKTENHFSALKDLPWFSNIFYDPSPSIPPIPSNLGRYIVRQRWLQRIPKDS